LRRLIRREQVTNALIFCNRKIEVDILYKSLKKHGFSVGALHGDMDQSQRFATLNAFKANELQLLVCSDVAARGLDIGGLSHVFNFDVPFHSEDYVHRIGRTGRAGREGHAYSIATADDARNVAAIEKLTGKAIPLLDIEGLEPVTEAEIQEALTSPKRGRGRGGPARRPDRRDGGRARPERGRRDGPDRAPRPEAPEELAAEAPARRDRPERRPRAEAQETREAPRRDRDRAPRRDRDAQPSEFALREAAMRDLPPRDREAPRYERDHRGRDRRDDLGPPVQGFGDLVPAFMLIPVPRPRRATAPAAVEDAPEVDAA
jgi:superfamily II DNA/RNA helicase